MANLLGGSAYAKRPVETDLKKLPAYLGIELANIQRRIAGVSNRTVTSSTTVLASDGLILCDTTSFAISVTWPLPYNQTEDWLVTIKRISAGGLAVTIVGTVDSVVNPVLNAQYKSITIWSSGDALHKVASV